LTGKNIPFEVIALSEQKRGKKNALMVGIQKAQSRYIQTLDADVWFENNFFANLPNPKDNEMLILPVRMVGFDSFTKLMELEYGSFQILQAGVALDKPLMASGANLIADREIYLNTNDLSKHAHRASGDDQYALALFIQHQRKINTYYDLDLAVYTKTPDNFLELLQQRTRWMGNNTQGNDWRALGLALVIFGVNITLLIILFKGLLFGFTSIELYALGLKFFADFLMYFNWFKRNETWRLSAYLPLLSILYPFYLINLLWRHIRKKNLSWKSRPIIQAKPNKEQA
jgi:glycosyltransferase involved in cell wall biosynthesis